MKRAVVEHAGNVALVVGLVAIAVAVTAYILDRQGFRWPIIGEDTVPYEFAFTSAQAVTPGQGQTVQVAGVKIGTIESVRLEGGRAVVGVGIDPDHRELVRVGSTALLRPRTPLKDMYIHLMPALDQPVAEPGHRFPISSTLPDVDLHQILDELDQRTRDYVQLFVAAAARGLEDRGDELAEVFRRFRPTARDLARVNRAVATERAALRRLITSLADVNSRLARNPRALTELVDASAAALGAFAAEDDALRAGIAELAPTLAVARRTLRAARPFAAELGPTSAALIPVLLALDDANPELRRMARITEPLLEDPIRPFVMASQEVIDDVRPAVDDLADSMPDLDGALDVVNRFLNMLAFNPGGAEPPSGSPDREEGYLFWIAWLGHQTVNLINIDDGNGPLRPIFLTGTCTTLQTLLKSYGADAAVLEFGLNLSAILANLCDAEEGPGIDLDQVLDSLPPEVIEQLPVDPLRAAFPDARRQVRRALAEGRR